MLKNVTSDKDTVDFLMCAVSALGVKTCVESPGSRNIPLMLASNARIENIHTVIDERVAAFMALGISEASRLPVALICTSGTATLNYSPAVAEAYYRRLPLVVITADRPERWINQSDGQTIIQPGIYSNFIKAACDIDGEISSVKNKDVICEILYQAISFPQGPVHINVRLDVPLGKTMTVFDRHLGFNKDLSSGFPLHTQSNLFMKDKVMVIVGDNVWDNDLRQALGVLDKMPNVVILAEHNANAGIPDNIANIDEALKVLRTSGNEFIPDIVFTVGGGLIAPGIKKAFRELAPDSPPVIEVCKVPFRRNTYCALNDSWDLTPAEFLLLVSNIEANSITSGYRALWEQASSVAIELANSVFVNHAAAGVIKILMSHLRPGENLVLSNGLTVRMAQYFKLNPEINVSCNRGVSGIDGSTSTALGIALSSPSTKTLFISGDMSFQYDIGALGVIGSLACRPDFKIVVISNKGGHIFRQIAASKNLDVEEWIYAPLCLPLADIAGAYKIPYFRYDGTPESVNPFMEEPRTAIMEICVDPQKEKEITELYNCILKQYKDEKRLDPDKGVF